MTSLAEVFDEHFKNTKFDSKLANKVYHYQVSYVNANREHLEFFGGNLLGVQVIRFKDSDVNKLFDDVLDIDYLQLSQDLLKVDDINQDFKVSSDVLNLTCMYLIYRFLRSPLLNDDKRHRGAYDVALIFFYRCISALISYYFRYPADPYVAQATYANLSNKYLIKKLGSWQKVMNYRATDLIGKTSIHYKNILKFNDDLTIVYAINDSQGRIRDLVKNYYAEFVKVKENGESITTTSSTYKDAEGEDTLKDKTKGIEGQVTYINNIITDRHSFIRDDLISVILSINKNTSFRMVKQVLNWVSDQSSVEKNRNLILSFVDKVIIYSNYLIKYNINNTHERDYPYILNQLKNLYLSTRSIDEDLIEIRDLGEKIINSSQKIKLSESLILSTRTSIILYITLRTLIGHKN